MDIIDGVPLLVAATPEEATHAPDHLPLLVTGVGTMACAISLTSLLAEARAEGRVPSRLINFGTAGALKDGLAGIYEISSVYQYDFDSDKISQITGKPWPNRLELTALGGFSVAELATGDRFVSDSALRAELAQHADLAEMEGYAVARVGAHFDVPVTLLKQVSDGADELAPKNWTLAAEEGAQDLGSALARVVG